MDNDGTTSQNEKPADAFEAIASAMVEFRSEMEYYNGRGEKIAKRTRFIMRAVFATLIVSSIYLVFMIFQMANNMSVMTGHLESMYSRFGSMSQDMREITGLVDSMGKSISGIPAIAQSMTLMDEDVGAMSGSVFEMNTSMTAIDSDMVRINTDMHEITGRLSNMNRAVNWMTRDVNEMAAPMNSGPMSDFWPR
jgi:methyl-accepting chemotaxis protein